MNSNSPRKLISIISPTYNEGGNVHELYNRVCTVIDQYPKYNFEYVIIDNASNDDTVYNLKQLAKTDKRLKLIINNRNFGHIRSPYWGIIQTSGDATIYLASDLQDPPELIHEFIRLWEEGYKIVLAAKPVSYTGIVAHRLRKAYYRILDAISEVDMTKDTTGFGIYDKEVIDLIRRIDDPYPYLRGLVCELGYEIKTIDFDQPKRIKGISKNNFGTLYDIAILGVVSHSVLPIRMASFLGLFIGVSCLLLSILVFVLKLLLWDSFPLGYAPFAIFMLLMFGLVLFFIGLIGEYIGSILTYLQKRPIVVEKERVNFVKK